MIEFGVVECYVEIVEGWVVGEFFVGVFEDFDYGMVGGEVEIVGYVGWVFVVLEFRLYLFLFFYLSGFGLCVWGIG